MRNAVKMWRTARQSGSGDSGGKRSRVNCTPRHRRWGGHGAIQQSPHRGRRPTTLIGSSALSVSMGRTAMRHNVRALGEVATLSKLH